MEAEKQFNHRLILSAAATFIVLATGVRAGSEELLFSPNPSNIGSSPFSQTEQREKSSSATKLDNNSTEWMRLPQASPFIGTDFSKNIGGSNIKNSSDVSSISGSTVSNDQFRLGNSYFGIQTQKNVKTPEPLRRTDCATDDECADYSGLPKSEPPKTTVKNSRKPFIGLSITTPLR